jgi:hypothetical protein
MLIKIIGCGLKTYLKDKFNLFDSFIVLTSIIEMVINIIDYERPNSGIITAFRGFRLLRIFKIARNWKSF